MTDIPATESFVAPTWAASITSVSDAKEQLLGREVEYYEIDFKNDDVDEVEHSRMQELSEVIFNNLLHASPSPPDSLEDKKKAAYIKSQSNALKKCKVLMKTAERVKDASSRCMLAVEAAVKLHRDGIPTYELDQDDEVEDSALEQVPPRKRKRSLKFSGYYINFSSKCSDRIIEMAGFVRDNKLVARDVLTGQAMDSFARAPSPFAKRKQGNLKSNTTKAKYHKGGQEAEKRLQAKEEQARLQAEEETGENDDTAGEVDEDKQQMQMQLINATTLSPKVKNSKRTKRDNDPEGKEDQATKRKKSAKE